MAGLEMAMMLGNAPHGIYGHIVVGDHNTQRILSEMQKEFSVTVVWADGREEQMMFPNIARVAVDEVYNILIEHRGAGRTKMLVESICSEVRLEGPKKKQLRSGRYNELLYAPR